MNVKAPSYDHCPHIQVGPQVSCTVTNCTICDRVHQTWLRTQPWYVRLDEWQHRQPNSGRLWWHRVWRPFCNVVDWTYRR